MMDGMTEEELIYATKIDQLRTIRSALIRDYKRATSPKEKEKLGKQVMDIHIELRGLSRIGTIKKRQISPTVQCRQNSHEPLLVNGHIRRLTPRETERLQGFPDDWTRWGIDENGDRVEISDTQRYKMTGNAVTVNVIEEIGRRLSEG